jgi:hypothetical protein
LTAAIRAMNGPSEEIFKETPLRRMPEISSGLTRNQQGS